MSEEIQEEIIALESIYDTEFTRISDNEFQVFSNEITFTFSYPKNYPFESIQMTCSISTLDDYISEKALALTGMSMVYSLIECTIEYYNDLVVNEKLERDLNETKIKEEREKEELLKFIGNQVTRETFLEWHSAYLKEFPEVKRDRSKLTGKQLFMEKKAVEDELEEGDDVDVEDYQGLEEDESEDEDVGLTFNDDD